MHQSSLTKQMREKEASRSVCRNQAVELLLFGAYFQYFPCDIVAFFTCAHSPHFSHGTHGQLLLQF
ncbi:hypothetical protein LR48_Vigan197s000200 [Vigna angularis]|uniref:Uncharacterized protein n=1 Tax=Phaseolus angularis TaxID=3914 RepID=A0A0L9T5H7_PHAAN|nr:hypothetical protein LR48_Vigan197s000200 [Vigna angularis]